MANSVEYRAFRASFDKLVRAVKSCVQSVARKAFEKNLITDQNLTIAGIQSIDDEHRATILLQLILMKIELTETHFNTFLGILEGEPVLKDIADEIKAKSLELKHQAVHVPATPKPDASKYSEVAVSSQFTFPSVAVRGISSAEIQRLESRLYYESAKMGEKFHHLYSSTFESLRVQKISVSKIVRKLVGFQLQPVYKDSEQPTFRKQVSKLRRAQSIDDVMDVVIDYCSFFNFQLLECLIDNLGSNEDKRTLQEYKDEFAKYAKRKVYEMPSEVCHESDNCQALVYVTLDKSFEQFTVNELHYLQGKLCEVLQVLPNSLQLCHVKPGSLKLIFQVPCFAELPVFPLSQDKEEALTKLGVTYLSYQFSSSESIKYQQEYVTKKMKKQDEIQDRPAQTRAVRNNPTHFDTFVGMENETIRKDTTDERNEAKVLELKHKGPKPDTSTPQLSKVAVVSEYEAVQTAFPKLVDAVKSSVEKVAAKAFEKQLITEQTLSTTLNQTQEAEQRASMLVLQVMNMIKLDPAYFNTFVSILESEPVLKDIADELTIKTKSSELKHKPVHVPFKRDATPTSKHPEIAVSSLFSFPSVAAMGISSAEIQRLESRLYYESTKMGEKFNHLYTSTFESLRKQNIPVSEIVCKLVGFNQLQPVFRDSDQPSFRKQLSKLQRAQTIDDVMDVVIDYCSFFNFQILECLIDNLGTNEDVCILQEYRKEFAEYAKRKVYEMPSEVNPESENGQALVYVLLDESFEDFTVKELFFFQGKLCEVLQVSQYLLQFCRITPG